MPSRPLNPSTAQPLNSFMGTLRPLPAFQRPRLLFDFDLPRSLCPVEAALPPPRLTLVPPGFLPELRFSPGLLPAAGPDGLRFFWAI